MGFYLSSLISRMCKSVDSYSSKSKSKLQAKSNGMRSGHRLSGRRVPERRAAPGLLELHLCSREIPKQLQTYKLAVHSS